MNNDNDEMVFEEDDDFIGEIIEEAVDQMEKTEEQKQSELAERARVKRKEKYHTKKQLGIRKPKQGKHPTRSHTFLAEPISDKAIHVVLNHQRTDIYKDGSDFCPRILMGIPGYGKPSKKNVYEHLTVVQEKIREARGKDPSKAPNWIIISNDTSMIMDRNILARLAELRDITHMAAPYGFTQIRSSGRWYEVQATDQSSIHGCYMQGSMDKTDWDFVIGEGFRDNPRMRILICHGPFCAIRGETFMKLDFSFMKENIKKGFFHYMADLSLEVHKRGHKIAQIKSSCMQFENLRSFLGEADFQHDQKVFTTKWQKELPITV